MTDSKHTPGPWRHHNVQQGRYAESHYIVANTYSTPSVIDGRDQIATCHGLSTETIANAHLIAAAPDLLAALETAQYVMGILQDSKYDFAKAAVRAAIAKARGEG